MVIRRNGMRWLLAGLAMTGLAGGVLAATDPSGDQQGPNQAEPGNFQAQAHHGAGHFNRPGGPQGPHMGPRGWHRPMYRRHGGRFMLDGPLLLSFRRLQLTDDQWQRVQAILEVQHLRSGTDAGNPQQRRELIAALFDPGNPNHAQAVQTVKDRAVARIDQAAHAQQALYEVLTPEQKTHLQQLVAQRQARMQQYLQHRGQATPDGQ